MWTVLREVYILGDIKYLYGCNDCNEYTAFLNEENDNPNKVCRHCNSNNIYLKKAIDVDEAHRKYGDPVIECPYCHSKDTKKISTGSRMLSAGLFGFGSSKIGKQWHCNNCKSDF